MHVASIPGLCNLSEYNLCYSACQTIMVNTMVFVSVKLKVTFPHGPKVISACSFWYKHSLTRELCSLAYTGTYAGIFISHTSFRLVESSLFGTPVNPTIVTIFLEKVPIGYITTECSTSLCTIKSIDWPLTFILTLDSVGPMQVEPSLAYSP